jgi:YVTN family beta-propeller protein
MKIPHSALRSQPILLLAMFALLCSIPAGISAEDGGTLKLTCIIPLPGVNGRFDHFAVDTNTHQLFVAALGNNTVEVIDTATARRVHTIAGQHKPTGIAFVPTTGRVFVANGDDDTLKVYESQAYTLVKSISGLPDADNVRYDQKANLLYIGYGDGALAVIDPAKLQTVATIKLEAHPESFQLEQNGPRIFVNLPNAKQVAVIDRDRRAVITTWPLKNFQANFPMALDETNHRLLVACRKPARLVVLDTSTGKPVADLGISGDTDDLFYDAARKLIYISCGEGFVDVVIQEDANRYKLLERIATRAGARTSFFSGALKQLFVAVPVRAAQDAELRVFAVAR